MQLQDQALFIVYAKKRNPKVREELITRNKGLVIVQAKKFVKECREPLDDLVQEGWFGLIKAIDRFDPYRGISFSSFAVPFIKGAILQYLRDKAYTVKAPRPWQETYSKVRRAHARTEGQVSEKVVAAQFGVTETAWSQYKQACQGFVSELKPEIYEDLSSPVEEEVSPATKEKIEIAMMELPSAERQVVQKVFFEQLNKAQAAKELGITHKRLDRKLANGLSIMAIALKNLEAKTLICS